MADGSVHLKVALVADIGMAYAVWELLQSGQVEAALGIGVGAALGTIITPDYDINGTTITESLIRKYIPVVGDFWVADWYLYSLWAKHRGVSHLLVIGTVTRVVYLAWRCWWWYVFAAGVAYLYLETHLQISLPFSLQTLWWMFIAWCVHDLLHIYFDRKGKKKHVNYKRYAGSRK